MICNYCYEPVSAGDSRCSNCGEALASSSVGTALVSTESNPSQALSTYSYQEPSHSYAAPGYAGGAWLTPEFLFSAQGRVGRLHFFLFCLLMPILPGFVMILNGVALDSLMHPRHENLIHFVVGLSLAHLVFVIFPMFYIMICLIIKRLHDLNRSGWLALVFLIPPLSLLLYLLPGTPGPNRFGNI